MVGQKTVQYPYRRTRLTQEFVLNTTQKGRAVCNNFRNMHVHVEYETREDDEPRSLLSLYIV